MSEFHLAYLSLGSNIEPEVNLPKAVRLLSERGEIVKVSGVWESQPVGGGGGNYLNACLCYKTIQTQEQLKAATIHPIETSLGRKRSEDKYAPRTIDIDIILFDNEIVGGHWLAQAFVAVPLAEIYPAYRNPVTRESILETAARLRSEVWMEARPEVSSRFRGNSFKGQN
jgi:2-amino-4-hydroxy-6-hydroxymethyldihydropteridine diphosphokinase